MGNKTNMDQKNNWIDNMLNTEDYIRSAKPSEELLNRLKQISAHAKTQYELVPKRIVWSVAASIALLIVLNLFSASRYESNSKEVAAQKTELSESYFSYQKQI